MAYWLRAVVQFVVLTFQFGAKVFTNNTMGILCKLRCLELVSGLILLGHTEILYFKTLQTLLGACEQIKRSKKLFIS